MKAIGVTAAVTAFACAASMAHALEASTQSNNRASNAAVIRHLAAERADQLAEVSVLQSKVNTILTCTYKGRFYAPEQADADSQGCTDIEVTIE